MMNQNKKVEQSQNLVLTAKYTQLNKYEEISDFELSIVAGGGTSTQSCNTQVNCPANTGATLPLELRDIKITTA